MKKKKKRFIQDIKCRWWDSIQCFTEIIHVELLYSGSLPTSSEPVNQQKGANLKNSHSGYSCESWWFLKEQLVSSQQRTSKDLEFWRQRNGTLGEEQLFMKEDVFFINSKKNHFTCLYFETGWEEDWNTLILQMAFLYHHTSDFFSLSGNLSLFHLPQLLKRPSYVTETLFLLFKPSSCFANHNC